jgi:hypothetical protein
MEPNRKQSDDEGRNSLCIQGKGVKPGVKEVENPQQCLKQIRISEDLTNLHEDLTELNQILNVARRSAVRDTIQTEIHQTTAKIDSLHNQQNPTPENSSKQLVWSEVVGKKKKIVPVTQPVTYNIPVSTNHYNMPSHDEGYIKNNVINQSSVVQSEQNKKMNKIDGGNKELNKIVILGDSHAMGCASEVQHNLDSNFVTQGMVKPGANIKDIITQPISITKKLSKKDVVVIWGGTWVISKNESKNAIH